MNIWKVDRSFCFVCGGIQTLRDVAMIFAKCPELVTPEVADDTLKNLGDARVVLNGIRGSFGAMMHARENSWEVAGIFAYVIAPMLLLCMPVRRWETMLNKARHQIDEAQTIMHHLRARIV